VEERTVGVDLRRKCGADSSLTRDMAIDLSLDAVKRCGVLRGVEDETDASVVKSSSIRL
jgi:hypothetical protein